MTKDTLALISESKSVSGVLLLCLLKRHLKQNNSTNCERNFTQLKQMSQIKLILFRETDSVTDVKLIELVEKTQFRLSAFDNFCNSFLICDVFRILQRSIQALFNV